MPAPQAFNTRVVLEGAGDVEELHRVLLDAEPTAFTPNLDGYVKFQPFLPDPMLRDLYHARATAPPPASVFGDAWETAGAPAAAPLTRRGSPAPTVYPTGAAGAPVSSPMIFGREERGLRHPEPVHRRGR